MTDSTAAHGPDGGGKPADDAPDVELPLQERPAEAPCKGLRNTGATRQLEAEGR